MIEFHGKSIPMTLEELVDPRYTALVVVDVQNYACMPEGIAQEHGRSLFRGDAIIKNLKVLIEEARKVGVRIVYIQNTTLPGHITNSPSYLRRLMKLHGVNDPNLIPEETLEGSWGHQIVEDIKPRHGDLVVKKHRASAFIGTDLDLLLRSNNIKSLLVTGVVTHGCVMHTVFDAQAHDYFVVIVRDCVDSTRKELHDAALTIFETRDVATSDQLVKIWKKTCRI